MCERAHVLLWIKWGCFTHRLSLTGVSGMCQVRKRKNSILQHSICLTESHPEMMLLHDLAFPFPLPLMLVKTPISSWVLCVSTIYSFESQESSWKEKSLLQKTKQIAQSHYHTDSKFQARLKSPLGTKISPQGTVKLALSISEESLDAVRHTVRGDWNWIILKVFSNSSHYMILCLEKKGTIL